ncbi:MAG: 50S ribosomal protein L32 [bacterium]|nr:50S ribosomal protein L32 [bacterium]
MSVRMRHTVAHTRNRRSHHGLNAASLLKCKKCNEPVLPLTLCMNCGTYKGREIIDTLKKLTKLERKKKEKEKELSARGEGKEKASGKSLDAAELSKK